MINYLHVQKFSHNKNQGKKLEQEQDTTRPINFMMSVKQRPGAELRRANFNPVKTEEPKTMIEIISREGKMVSLSNKYFCTYFHRLSYHVHLQFLSQKYFFIIFKFKI